MQEDVAGAFGQVEGFDRADDFAGLEILPQGRRLELPFGGDTGLALDAQWLGEAVARRAIPLPVILSPHQ